MSAICAKLGSKGKVGVQRGRETAGVPSFLPPAAGAAVSRRPQTANPPAEVQRKTLRPLGANTLTQFAHPDQPVLKRSRPDWANTLTQFACPVGAVQKRSRPVRANTLTQFARPAQPVQKRSRPERANTLTQFVCPGQPVQKKEPPRQGEHACGSSRAPVSRCRKSGKSRKNFPCRKDRKTPVLTLRKRLFG